MAIFKGFRCCNCNAKRSEDFGRKKLSSLLDLLNLNYTRCHLVEEIWWIPGDPAGATGLFIRIAILFEVMGTEPVVVVHISGPSTQELEAGGSRSSGSALAT